MANFIDISVDDHGFNKALDQAASRIPGSILSYMNEIARKTAINTKLQTFSSGRLTSRSGRLRDAIQVRASNSGNVYYLRAFNDYVSAWLQEVGGVVVAKRAKKLAIPSEAARDGSGSPIYQSPLNVVYPGRFVLRIFHHRPVLVERSNPKVVTHYLVPSAYVPPRFGFRKTVRTLLDQYLKGLLPRILSILPK